MTICTVNHFSYIIKDKAILRDISFTLNKDDITILCGHNGAGKSILLQALAALHTPLVPEIKWHIDDFKLSHIGYLPQKPYLLRRTVHAHIEFVQKLTNSNHNIDDILQQCHLYELKDNDAYALSGGERQLLAFAMLLASQAKILLLDEPTANLDPDYTQTIEKVIKYQQSLGIKIIIASHDQQQIQRLADDILLLERGCLKQHSKAKNFK